MNKREEEDLKIAEEVREACLKAAGEGFREASLSGLCAEGAIEAALGSIQSIDLKELIIRNSH
ncbi:MAG TPA: hypothetical protein VJ905_00945 [Halalkalibaculum sp.]|nr:hypothetical protein [Halalkalibaculum sp.]